jgi:5-(carboxyamino)imidazole ribonucleotide synthase
LTLGILGGGQLAKMLASAAYRMGLNVSIIEKGAETPAGDMTKHDFTLGWDNSEELDRFINSSDIITLENEFIDPEILEYIEGYRKVYPSAATMRLVQDKYIQKKTFQNAGLPTPIFDILPAAERGVQFGLEHGFPFVIKARKYGYDGYGNATVFNDDEIVKALDILSSSTIKRPLMAEKFVDFQKELAVIVARSISGNVQVYPCVETIQYRHICHQVIAEAAINPSIKKKAQEVSLAAVEAIGGVGVFGVELFLDNNENILLNEIAPRPHNSGHYTIEGCCTSQFENAIRAILDLPLGSSKLIAPAACMVNLLGKRSGKGTPESITEALRHDDVALHLYNKKESRVGRKMGHITALGNSQDEAIVKAQSAADAIVW